MRVSFVTNWSGRYSLFYSSVNRTGGSKEIDCKVTYSTRSVTRSTTLCRYWSNLTKTGGEGVVECGSFLRDRKG